MRTRGTWRDTGVFHCKPKSALVSTKQIYGVTIPAQLNESRLDVITVERTIIDIFL